MLAATLPHCLCPIHFGLDYVSACVRFYDASMLASPIRLLVASSMVYHTRYFDPCNELSFSIATVCGGAAGNLSVVLKHEACRL
jgi:hypothetical protein